MPTGFARGICIAAFERTALPPINAACSLTGGLPPVVAFGGAMDHKKLEDNVAPTAEMQLGEIDQVKQLVVDADLGGRSTVGLHGNLMLGVGLAWVIFQLWYASPLPFALRFAVFNDTEARSIHLATGLFLAFLAFPASKRSPRNYVPVLDWIFAFAGAFAAGYLYLFYNELASRPGAPTQFDVVVGVVGILLLLEATRRAVGLPMAVLAVIFLGYVLAGAYLPDVIAHKGASIPRTISHMWLVTEGVFGIALGVSVAFIFVFVLFGTLLDRAGGGNYMMQVSFALLGHMRGGPAKVAVVSSALNGLISGSSVSNVVSGGIFTIPLMKKAGYGGVKAAAIETSSSVNGQIMPPVMGAAAFLMVEYVGIPYSEIIRHAFIPAVISYIALFYIVHLEAMRLGMEPMAKVRERTARAAVLSWALGLAGTIAVLCAIYYVAIGTQAVFGAGRAMDSGALLIALVHLQHMGRCARARSAGRYRHQQSGVAARVADGESRHALPDSDRCPAVVLDGRRAVTRAVGVLRDCCAGHLDDDAASDDRAVPP